MADAATSSVPALSPCNTDAADDSTAALYAVQPKANPNSEDYGERSANLWADPKLRQLKKATTKKSLAQEDQQESGEQSKRLSKSSSTSSMGASGDAPARKNPTLRTNGCDIVDWHTKLIASRMPMLPQVGNGIDLDERYSRVFKHPEQALSLSKSMARNPDLQRRNNEKMQSRVHWKNTMDSSLKRLMMDVELAQDPAIGKRAHASSCNHLDKVHEWYLSHGKKEARKGMPGPSYLRYNAQDPVMPGSLRAPPQRFENPLGVGVGGGVSTLPGVTKRDLRGSQSEPSLQTGDWEAMSNPTTPAHHNGTATLKSVLSA